MEKAFQEKFMANWNRFFPGADLPFGFYYAPSADPALMAAPPKGHRCLIGDLAKVRRGRTVSFNASAIGCLGRKRYVGFEGAEPPDFEYFLSCGIPGRLEGERYKKSPELVREHVKQLKPEKAPTEYITFKRRDGMEEADRPLAVVFFAAPDVLSGLFTLANFDEPQPNGVIAPFGAGCASIVDYPVRELKSSAPRAVLGMFDVSARPCVPSNVLTFAVPWPKFVRMADNMEESFLMTKSWDKVRRRIKKESGG